MVLDRISKYRKEIMGIAILMIIFCHSTLHFEMGFISKGYIYIKQFCKIGVDIFFVMSGIGLYYSFSKDSNIIHFYKKRFFRVIPTYIVVVLVWAVISIGLSIEAVYGYFWKYSLVSFFVSGELEEWFIAAILFLYLIFPVLYLGLKEKRSIIYAIWIFLYCITFYISLICTDQSPGKLVNEVFVIRIPAFLVGMLLGNEMLRVSRKRLNQVVINLTGLICIGLLSMNILLNKVCERWVERILFLPCALCIIIWICLILDKLQNTLVPSALCQLGGMTLEIYLIHEKILKVYDRFVVEGTVGSLLSNLAAALLAIVISFLLSAMIRIIARNREAVKS